MVTSRAVEAYRTHQLELAVNSARPLELVVMLYDGAISATRQAIAAIGAGDVPTKAAQVSKATNIISELAGILDLDQGEVARNLAALYDYLRAQLLQANLRNAPDKLEEVARLLTDLRGSWLVLAERQREDVKLAAFAGAATARAG
ncbi:MAG: flagellar export chaperone FliS [Rhodocyclaceae bacterium]|nr:flagellar export chaperone FliS [Rhodocyclaceae bacterium]